MGIGEGYVSLKEGKGFVKEIKKEEIKDNNEKDKDNGNGIMNKPHVPPEDE